MADPLRHRWRPGRMTREDVDAFHALRGLLLDPSRFYADYPLTFDNDPDGRTYLGIDLSNVGDTTAGSLTVNNTLSLNYVSVTLTGGSTNNDYNYGSSSKLAVTVATSGATITGLLAGSAGQMLIIWNVGSQPLALANQSAASAAANRIITPLGADYTLWPNDGVILEYDATAQRWRFDTPTFGAGDATLRTYACRRLKFTTGLTYADNGDGSGTVTAAAAALSSGNLPLSATQAVGSGYAAIGGGFPFVAPATGTYLLTAQVEAHVVPHLGLNWIGARLRNSTAGVVIGSAADVVYEATSDEGRYATAPLAAVAPLTLNDHVELEAGYFGSGTPTTAEVLGADTGSLGTGGTILAWVKVA